MEARRRTWFDDRGLVIAPPDDAGIPTRVPVYSGALHYWRVDPDRWERALGTLAAQGLTVVESYVPWRVHEPRRGAWEWRGAANLGRFLELARTAGLAVLLRPGPAVNAELTSFGMPEHVLAEPDVQAITARGTPVWLPSPPRAWPVPSYASTAFREHVTRWYRAVADVIGPHLAPDGPVVALGVDNEARGFFRMGAFDHDYHPDALAWWREDSGHAEAPREWHPDDVARCAAWVRWKERYLARALGAFGRVMDDAGLEGIARFHNVPGSELVHADVRAMQAAIGGPVGLDAYTRRGAFVDLARHAAALAGMATVPIAFEVGVGYAPWFPPLSAWNRGARDPTRERDQLVRLLAGGVRGFNLFMAVERERFYGAAVSAKGVLEPHAAWIAPLVTALAEVDWPALRCARPVALVATRADERFGLATCLLDPITPLASEALGLGPGGAAELGTDAGAVLARRWRATVIAALDRARVAYAIVDEGASAAELSAYRVVICPTVERVDRALWAELAAVTSTVIIGPGKPARDELDRPLATAGPRRTGKLQADALESDAGLAALAADLAELAGPADPAWRLEGAPSARSVAYADARGDVRVVIVTNDRPEPVMVELVVEAAIETAIETLRDPFDGTLMVSGGRVALRLPAHGARLLVVPPRP